MNSFALISGSVRLVKLVSKAIDSYTDLEITVQMITFLTIYKIEIVFCYLPAK